MCAAMDFNVKKLASGAGVFFTRAVQVSLIRHMWTDLMPHWDEATSVMDDK